MGGGVQGGCEQRIEAFEKIKKIKNGWGVGSGGVGLEGGHQGGCDRRSEIFVKIQKKNWGGGGGGMGVGRGGGGLIRGLDVGEG